MSAGKGDRYRVVNGEKYRAEHDRIFRMVSHGQDAHATSGVGCREDLSRVMVEFGSEGFERGAAAALRGLGIKVRK
jgi:hypothetical protein